MLKLNICEEKLLIALIWFARLVWWKQRMRWMVRERESELERSVTLKRTALLMALIGFSALGRTWKEESFVSHSRPTVLREQRHRNWTNWKIELIRSTKRKRENDARALSNRESETTNESLLRAHLKDILLPMEAEVSLLPLSPIQHQRITLSFPLSSKSIPETKIQFFKFFISFFADLNREWQWADVDFTGKCSPISENKHSAKWLWGFVGLPICEMDRQTQLIKTAPKLSTSFFLVFRISISIGCLASSTGRLLHEPMDFIFTLKIRNDCVHKNVT